MEGRLRRISNSEATDFETCKRKYYNSYIRELAPRVQTGPMAIGTIGHLALEAYFIKKMEGADFETSKQAAYRVLNDLMKPVGPDKTIYNTVEIISVKNCLDKYFAFYGHHDDWRILEVEQEYEMPIPGRPFTFVMKLDLLIQDLTTGEVRLVDNKFTYDFWKSEKFDLRGQFPKYIACLRFNGKPVNGTLINQIRYRSMKSTDLNDYLRRENYDVTNNKIRHVLRDHVETSTNIIAFRALPADQQERKAVRLLVDPICKGCAFKQLCDLEMNDGFVTTMLEQKFIKNPYGYNHDPIPSVDEQLESLL